MCCCVFFGYRVKYIYICVVCDAWECVWCYVKVKWVGVFVCCFVFCLWSCVVLWSCCYCVYCGFVLDVFFIRGHYVFCFVLLGSWVSWCRVLL